MLKLLCPHCFKTVSIPESASGTEAPCPECLKPFPIPARYTPTVSPAAPPPSSTHSAEISPPPAVESACPAGYSRSINLTLSPCVVGWIPAVALSIILLLTFFPWVGVYPGGHAVYTQGVWRAISGWPKRDFQLEDLLLKDLPAPSLYDRTSSDWLITVPYLLGLILAVAAAWLERLNPPLAARRLPFLWPWRRTVVGVLAVSTLLLLSVESARGLGLERAMHSAVSEKFSEQRQKAATAGEQEKVDFLESGELAKYGLERTSWHCLAMWLHVLVPLAILAGVWLDRRGEKPHPRIALQY